MKLKKTNLKKALNYARSKDSTTPDILEAVQRIFEIDQAHTKRIEENIQQSTTESSNWFNFDLLESENIYHIEHIKQICIDYRLRFLDSKYFKGDIPPEAISKIKQLEKQHNSELTGFKIVAPSKLFKLKDKDDPLLFVPLGND